MSDADAPVPRPAGAAAPGRVEPPLWIVVQPDGEPAYTSARATHDEAMQACFGNRWNTHHPRDWWQHNLDAGWTCREIALSSGAAAAGAGAVPDDWSRLRSVLVQEIDLIVVECRDDRLEADGERLPQPARRVHGALCDALAIIEEAEPDAAAPSPEPRPAEGTAAEVDLGEVERLAWEKVTVDRGDGTREVDGWEAPSGFATHYTVSIHADHYEVCMDFERLGVTDGPDAAKAMAQADFDRRVRAALRSTPGAAAEAVPGIYMASKAVHGPRWRELRDAGWPIVSTWIDEAEAGRTTDWADLWDRCAGEPARAAVTVLYAEEGEELKGALAEVGAALSHGRKLIVVGPVAHTWTKHRNVHRAADLTGARELWMPWLVEHRARLARGTKAEG